MCVVLICIAAGSGTRGSRSFPLATNAFASFVLRGIVVDVTIAVACEYVGLGPQGVPRSTTSFSAAMTSIRWRGVVFGSLRVMVFAAGVPAVVGAVIRALVYLGQPLLQQGIVDSGFSESAGPMLGESLDDGCAIGIDIAILVFYRSNGAGSARVETLQFSEDLLFVLKIDWVSGGMCGAVEVVGFLGNLVPCKLDDVVFESPKRWSSVSKGVVRIAVSTDGGVFAAVFNHFGYVGFFGGPNKSHTSGNLLG